MSTNNSESSQPRHTLSENLPGGGQLQCAVWQNDASKDGESFTSYGVTIKRFYFDDSDKKWKPAKSFRSNDLLHVAFAAQELYRKVEELKHQ